MVDKTGSVSIRPAYTALWIAGAYLFISAAYIVISGRIASRMSLNVEQMAAIETVKGVSFVSVTALLLFWVIWWMLRRLLKQQEQLHIQQTALMESEKRGAAGAFAASVAHDISNVLVISQYAVAELEKFDGSARCRACIADLKSADSRLNDLSHQLHRLAFGNNDHELKYINFSDAVARSVGFARMHADVRRCQVVSDIEDSIVLLADEEMTQRMTLNLLVNAAQAVDCRGRIRIVLSTVDNSVVFEVHDDGPGIDPAIRDRILEPMYTTKPKGSGLGLLSLRFFLDKHSGRLHITESDMGGACFKILLPKQSALSAGAA